MHFLVKRAGSAVVTLFLVSLFCFISFSVIRGDPAVVALGLNASPEQVAAYRQDMNLSGSGPGFLALRYFRWLGNFITGNPGHSLRFRGDTVSALILDRFPVSCTLAVMSLFFIIVLSVPLSLFSVRRKDGIVDRMVTIGAAVGISMPNFFLGVLFIWIFGIGLRLFSAGLYVDWRVSFSGFIHCLVFPALAIALPNASILTKFLRTSLFREQQSDYFRTAVSKGAGFMAALRRHALRNAAIPSIAVMGMIFAEVFSGSIIIEQVFAIPGLGKLLITAITSRDYPVIQALVMYSACIVILANTLADIAIQAADPRIRIGDKRQ